MACHLLGTKPLPEPIMSFGTSLTIFDPIYDNFFFQENVFEFAIIKMLTILMRCQSVNIKHWQKCHYFVEVAAEYCYSLLCKLNWLTSDVDAVLKTIQAAVGIVCD